MDLLLFSANSCTVAQPGILASPARSLVHYDDPITEIMEREVTKGEGDNYSVD